MERGIDGIGRRLWGVDDNPGKMGRPCRVVKCERGEMRPGSIRSIPVVPDLGR